MTFEVNTNATYVALLSLSFQSATKRVFILSAAQLSCAFPQPSIICKGELEVPERRNHKNSKHVVLPCHSRTPGHSHPKHQAYITPIYARKRSTTHHPISTNLFPFPHTTRSR
ncbi:hypothetical protein HBI56_030160 [Parastagonospora nodorum]|uniref:Uncharacterized protein n=1 Tax=Phaeosphaeria nodorum (strain SN15 / ATCC MYA-4574 / FGSC 10173) TaxID=321614 RepID=A0A7U2EY29_PHANO|nr:hypothetical protein HBH56_017770 [Parastagonospora nodorum]QRC95213.1 hypothetical protein JI435_431940 [Parastagonospora nodorum SN15]KAH3936881.1 hypothetical protein HBH54_016720 [Parastagonospora nodorum]KAH3953592.1 hypothetical protein HBH53_028820 [Parastagonospora nodorum]KAH3962598.1 hypothetical protein HBH51_172910 [Parastagonospora nodorum]